MPAQQRVTPSIPVDGCISRRYRGGKVPRLRPSRRLAHIEGPNEIDSGQTSTGQQQADQLLAELRTYLDTNALGISLLSPSHIYGPPTGAYTAADYGNMHSYPGGKKPSNSFRTNLDNFARATGGKPNRTTETGYHNAVNAISGQPAVTQEAAAVYIPRMVLEYQDEVRWGEEVTAIDFYELLDDPDDTNADGIRDNDRAEASFGLANVDGTLKLQGQALANLIAFYDDASVPATLDTLTFVATAAVQYDVHEQSDGTILLSLWRDVIYGAAAIPVTVSLAQSYALEACTITEVVNCTVPVAAHEITADIGDALTVLRLR